MRFLVSAGILLALWCVAQAADTPKTYNIVLNRSCTVGEKYNIAVSGSEEVTRTTSSDDEILEEMADEFTVRLEGTVKVLKVNAQKAPVKVSLTIARCVKVVGDKNVSLAKKGTVVTVTAGSCTIDDEPADAELQRALGLAVSLTKEDPDIPTDDAIFGTKKPQRVGESWDINEEKAAALIAFTGMSVAPEDVRGKSTLQEVTMIGDQPCLRITSQMQARKLHSPASFPPFLKLTKSSFIFNMACIYPVDVAQKPVEEQTEVTFELLATGKPTPDAPMATIKAMIKRAVTTKYSKAE